MSPLGRGGGRERWVWWLTGKEGRRPGCLSCGFGRAGFTEGPGPGCSDIMGPTLLPGTSWGSVRPRVCQRVTGRDDGTLRQGRSTAVLARGLNLEGSYLDSRQFPRIEMRRLSRFGWICVPASGLHVLLSRSLVSALFELQFRCVLGRVNGSRRVQSWCPEILPSTRFSFA